MSDGLNIDLHTHSNCSDGSLSPAELVARAAAAGVQVLALTDHDTVAGLEEAQRAAGEHGMQLVPGVEISASWRAQAIHVLGLWIDPVSPPLRREPARTGEPAPGPHARKCARDSRNSGCRVLNCSPPCKRFPACPRARILADALVAGGHVDTRRCGISQISGQGKAAHVAAEWPALEVVVGWICAAGGVAALAHPMRYALSAGARRRLLGDFAAAGGTALEVVSGGNSAQHVDTCATLAVNFGFQGSVGSDFHSPHALGIRWAAPLSYRIASPRCGATSAFRTDSIYEQPP